MSRRAVDRSGGFTLLEVLLAVFVFGTVMSVLLTLTSQSLQTLGTAKEELEATQLGETMMRDMLENVEDGKLPEIGVTVGDVVLQAPATEASGLESDAEPASGSAYQYRLEIEPYTVPLSEDAKGDRATLSSLFTAPESSGATSSTVRITLRIHRADQDPEETLPFVMILAEPAKPLPGVGGGGGPSDGTGADAAPASPATGDGGEGQNLLRQLRQRGRR
jgi:prepilin-type N-terminal cleavage/methylation domain-containing protein